MCINDIKKREKKNYEKKLFSLGSTENKNLICLLKAIKDLNVKLTIVIKIDLYHKTFFVKKFNYTMFENHVGISMKIYIRFIQDNFYFSFSVFVRRVWDAYN